MYTVKIIEENEISSILPYLKMLNEKTDEAILVSRLKEMMEHNYKCVGVYDNENLIGITGFWILYKHYVGKHIEPDNVIIHPDYRSKGIGELMMNWLYTYAKAEGCLAVELNCYVSNHKGVRFWIQQGYRIIGYHMQKLL